ncbi:hypothetical protein DUNSADRAFT_11422 [Dunaliella salina]|uniref:Uncharacterized protein n=1 Tax=Dunaliella salina TaxID=3046 RepID=A0ABQ7GDF7_DUNSA|nr:hypothetical protein DUNSADRAFT_11422 [Dunaliella salina]|eukprot:KAF5832636.1 hypothetical protein DUNSADRAFT_11422 [Dunaliella salina]
MGCTCMGCRNLCSMVEQVAVLQHHGRRFAAADGLAMYLAICMLAEMYDEGGLVSGPMTASKKVHELSDALIEAFLGTWLEERVVFERWLVEACPRAGGLVHISWAQPSLPTPVRCYLMGQLELKLLEARRSKPTRNEYDRKLQRFRLWYNRRCIWLNLPGLMFSMNGSELAGFVHGAEVVEPRHLATVVHSSTLWPPQQAPPQRVKRTVVVYLMQSFSGQGKGVGRSIVHALREGGVSCQDPTSQKQEQQQPLAQDPTSQKQEQQQPLAQVSQVPQAAVPTGLDRLTSIQILQQLMDERALERLPAAQQKPQQNKPMRGQQEAAQMHENSKTANDKSDSIEYSREGAGLQGPSNQSSNAADHPDSGRGSGGEWLVLADAPMENARPFWHKMGVPVAIESSYTRDAWVDLGWHSTSDVRLGEEPEYTPGS